MSGAIQIQPLKFGASQSEWDNWMSWVAQWAQGIQALMSGLPVTAQGIQNIIYNSQSTANAKMVQFVNALPATGSFQGQLVYNTADDNIYKWNSTTTSWDLASATDLSQLSGQITTTQITDSAITTPKVAAGAITAAEIAAATITGGNIAATTITSSNIANGTLTATQMANQAITAAKILDGTLTATQIANGAITTTQIAAGTITGSNIAASTITGAKIAATTIEATNIVAKTITAGNIATGAVSESYVNSGVNGSAAPGVTTTMASQAFAGGHVVLVLLVGTIENVPQAGVVSGINSTLWIYDSTGGEAGFNDCELIAPGTDQQMSVPIAIAFIATAGDTYSIKLQNYNAAGNDSVKFLGTLSIITFPN